MIWLMQYWITKCQKRYQIFTELKTVSRMYSLKANLNHRLARLVCFYSICGTINLWVLPNLNRLQD